jgi:hypothetical protein
MDDKRAGMKMRGDEEGGKGNGFPIGVGNDRLKKEKQRRDPE